MRTDDDAKLIFIGKKHINFSNKRTNRGKEREIIDLSRAFSGFLKSFGLLNKDNLEKDLRKNFERGRDYSKSRSRSRSESSVRSEKKKKKKESK